MRTNRAAKNVLASCLYKVIALVCGLIIPRLMLSNFGSEYNGIVASATQFMNYITILTIGIAGPTRVALYDSLAKDDNEKTSGVLKATAIYMRKFSIAIILYTIVIMMALPVVAHTSLPKIEVALLTAIVSLSMFVEYFFTVTNHTLLTADQREYIFDLSSSTALIINCILTYGLIKAGYNIFIVRFVSSLIFLLKPLFIAVYIKRHYIIYAKVSPNNSALKQRGSAAAVSIANLVHDNIDLVLLTFVFDIKLVSVYTVYNMITAQIRSVLQIFTGSLEAGFGNIIAKKEKKALIRNFKIYEFIVFSFVSIVISCVFVLIVSFVENYTDGVTDINYIVPSFAFLTTLCEATYCIRQPYVTLVQAAGKYKETRNGAILEAVLNASVSIILMYLIGFQGVVAGTIMANILRSVQYCIFTYRSIIGQKLSRVAGKLIWCGSNIAIICLGSSFLLEMFSFGTGWMQWFLQAVMVFFIALAVTLISAVLFYKDDLKSIKDIVLRLVIMKGNK